MLRCLYKNTNNFQYLNWFFWYIPINFCLFIKIPIFSYNFWGIFWKIPIIFFLILCFSCFFSRIPNYSHIFLLIFCSYWIIPIFSLLFFLLILYPYLFLLPKIFIYNWCLKPKLIYETNYIKPTQVSMLNFLARLHTFAMRMLLYSHKFP